VARHCLEVRAAGAGDLDALLVLWAQARAEMVAAGRHIPVVPADAVRSRLVEVLADRRLDVLLAVQDGEAVGFALLRTAGLNPLVTMPVLQVDQLFVAATARRRGVGRALVAAVAAAADRAGVDQVVCNVVPGSRETHRFYARLGFRPMVVRRGTSVPALRRRLVGDGRRPALEDLLSRRRSLRARVLDQAEQASAGVDGPEACADGVA